MRAEIMKIGLSFRSTRISQAAQEEDLLAWGAEKIYRVPDRNIDVRSWRKPIAALVDGDVLGVYSLGLLPTERGGDPLTPTAQIADAFAEIHGAGAHLVEVLTGLSTADRKQRSALLKTTVANLRRGERVPRHGPPKRPGPKATTFTEEQLIDYGARWRAVKKYTTNAAALESMPGMDARLARLAFGLSGRRPGPRRKNTTES